MKSENLSRRERQIMDVLYTRGEASAAQVLANLPNPPGYSAVRALLRILEEKGIIKHREEGPRYIYSPTVPETKARRSALDRIVKTFFAGSLSSAVAALVDENDPKLTAEELKRIEAIIKQAKERRKP